MLARATTWFVHDLFQGGVHFSEGGYDRIAIKLFNEIDVDCYYVGFSEMSLSVSLKSLLVTAGV